MSYEFYKWVHLLAIFALFLACGGMVASNQSKTRWTAPLHGSALLFVLISGFGLISRLGLQQSMPTWVIGKLFIWLLFGGFMAVVKRKWLPQTALLPLLVLLGGGAAYLALWKP